MAPTKWIKVNVAEEQMITSKFVVALIWSANKCTIVGRAVYIIFSGMLFVNQQHESRLKYVISIAKLKIRKCQELSRTLSFMCVKNRMTATNDELMIWFVVDPNKPKSIDQIKYMSTFFHFPDTEYLLRTRNFSLRKIMLFVGLQSGDGIDCTLATWHKASEYRINSISYFGSRAVSVGK